VKPATRLKIFPGIVNEFLVAYFQPEWVAVFTGIRTISSKLKKYSKMYQDYQGIIKRKYFYRLLY
jgi:hypothetical protein